MVAAPSYISTNSVGFHFPTPSPASLIFSLYLALAPHAGQSIGPGVSPLTPICARALTWLGPWCFISLYLLSHF